jgi:hypothetical protein
VAEVFEHGFPRHGPAQKKRFAMQGGRRSVDVEISLPQSLNACRAYSAISMRFFKQKWLKKRMDIALFSSYVLTLSRKGRQVAQRKTCILLGVLSVLRILAFNVYALSKIFMRS